MMSATTGAVPAQPPKGAKKRSRGKKSVVDASVSVQDKPGSTAPASPVDGSTAAGASDTKPEKKFQVELNKYE